MQIKIGNNENQTINANIQMQEKVAGAGGRKAAKQQRKATIFAGDLPINKDPISLRRQQVQKKAMKFVQDAWNTDRKMDESREQIRALQEEQRKEALQNHELVQMCKERKENLRQQYGVDEDSQEQQDLELLMKGTHYDPNNPLTEEEKARLDVLRGQPRTEYQKKCLEIDWEQQIFEGRERSAANYAGYLQSSLTDMKIERLKFHKMADAQNKAEKVMEQASKDIQGMLIGDAKDHVDETYEEKREEAEKKAEEKEAEEEKIELRKEQKELMEARIDEARAESHEAEEAQRAQEKDAREEAAFLKDMAEAGMNVAGSGESVKAEIKDILNKMKLIEADIKGIEIDEEL
ncbi:MAG: hypothetical protein K2K90_15900 [Lachnospiraceae bacterium]|nr:hypothetical protein [Lachnospiraceae bacterium]